MQGELHERIVQGYVVRARKAFSDLQNNPLYLAKDENDTRKLLDKANEAAREYGLKPVDASVLDPTGRQSGAAMDKNILRAIEDERFGQASADLYFSRREMLGTPDEAAQYFKDDLAEANKAAAAVGDKPIDVSMLDPTGGRYGAAFDKWRELLSHYTPDHMTNADMEKIDNAVAQSVQGKKLRER